MRVKNNIGTLHFLTILNELPMQILNCSGNHLDRDILGYSCDILVHPALQFVIFTAQPKFLHETRLIDLYYRRVAYEFSTTYGIGSAWGCCTSTITLGAGAFLCFSIL